jgi:hypothetical protein
MGEILAAELSVAQSKQSLLDSMHRVPTAIRAAVTRPASLMLIMGAAGLWGYAFGRRTRAASPSDNLKAAGPPVAAGFVAAFIARYGMRLVTSMLQRAWAVRDELAAQAGLEASKTSSAANAAPGLRQ